MQEKAGRGEVVGTEFRLRSRFPTDIDFQFLAIADSLTVHQTSRPVQ